MRNVEGAKAGSNQKKPYRAPVSVTSTQRMRIKYGISEGTIRGFSAEFSHNEMLKRIYLDGTPIMSAEGEQLLDVVVEFRDGSRDQEPINGLPSISVEHDVGVEVKIAAPVSRSFDRSDTTSYDVRISVPTLYQGDDEGNSNKGLIQFKIDVSTDGGAFEEAGRFDIYEKILNGFAETYNVVVPKGSNHVVRISRLNSEVVSDYSVNRLVVEAITENTDVRLRYTNTAVLYLEYDAEQFSNVPKLEMRVFGKNDILVPANYNGDTHTYVTSGAGTTNGVWDGTWKRAYTDNPVWIALDLMISRRYGLGDKIDLTFINKWELYGLAQYCDEPVADGKGGFEPRFTCNNMYLQKSEDAYRVLKDLAASFRAKVVWDGEFITLQADVPRDPVHTFSNANASDITYSSTQDSAQRNLINVQYYDRDNKFASDVVMQRSNSNILSRGKVVDGNFTALGCASQGQAQRIASYVMNTELYETELVSFTTGLEGGLVRLNDVIQMADNSVAGQTVGGRIAAVNGRSITLDRKIPDNVQAIATTQLSINRQDVKNEPISIVSISDDRMTAVLASDAPAGTEAGLVWALLTQDLVPQKFVVTDIEFDSTNMTFALSAIQYNESKYAAIDGSARIVVPPISVTEYKMLKAPIIVIASYLTRIIQDAVVCDIDVSWAQSTNAVQYQLEMQKAGSDWRIVGRFMSLATTLDNMYTGTYTFRVCAYDSLGNASQYTYSDPILVAGKVLPPPALAQYSVIGILFGYQHKWIYPAHTEDSRAVRLRFTTLDPVASPSQEWQYIDVAYPTANFTEQDVSAGLRTWFSAAIVDKYGNVGAYTAWQSAVPSVDATQVLDLLDGQLTAQQLDQDLTNKIAIGAEAAEAAESAQNAADAAAQAAANAQTAANGASVAASNAQTTASTAQTAANTAKTAAATAQTAASNAQTSANNAAASVNALATEVDADITALSTDLNAKLTTLGNGLTQETTDRQNADTQIVGQLNTYKSSNDAALAAVQQKAESATTASTANAQALTNLTATVNTKNRTYRQTTAPTAGLVLGDLWINTTAGQNNQLRRWNGTAWDDLTDPRTAANATALTNLQTTVTAIDGRTTANANSITQLRTGLTTLSNNVDAKADASAVDSLTTRVSTAEGNITSQGTRVTNLENSVNHATTGLSTKASSSALTAVDNKVTAANGRIDTTNSDVTTLTGRVSTVEGAVATKAEASALTALTTRVTNAEGVNTSQGSAITTLQNTVNHATTGLATKASTSALTATNSEVTRINGVVTGHTNQLTQLASDITTINGTLATKANASALNDIYTKTQADAKATEIAAGEVAKYDARLVIGGVNLIPNSFDVPQVPNSSNWAIEVAVVDGVRRIRRIGTTNPTVLSNYTRQFLDLIVGTEYTISVKVKPIGSDYLLGFYGVAASSTLCKADQWTTLQATVKATTQPERVRALLSNAAQVDVWIEVKEWQAEIGNKATAWSPSPRDTQAALAANSTAIQNTNAEVTRVGGVATAANNATTALAGRVSTVEGAVATKAEASALTALTTRVTNAEGVNTSQGTAITTLQNTVNHATTGLSTKASSAALTTLDNKVTAIDGRVTSNSSSITSLNNSLTTTNTNVTAAQTAATNAMTAAGQKGKVIFGTTAPVAADQLSQNLWIDTTGDANTPKRWNGTAWVVVTDKVATDALAAANAASSLAATKADSSALTALDSKVTTIDGKVTTNASNITTLQGKVTTVENGLATKAEGSALSALTTRVTNAEGVNTSQGTQIDAHSTQLTSLNNSITSINSALSTKADSSALTTLESKVTANTNNITAQGTQLTQLGNRVTTVENGLTTKADAVALTNLATRVTATENGLTTQATQITTLKADLSSGGAANLGSAALTDPQVLIPMPTRAAHEPSLIDSALRTNGKAYNIKITGTSAGGSLYMGQYTASAWRDTHIRVRTGKRYLISAYMKSDATPAQVSMQLRVFAGDGVTAGGYTGALVTIGAPTAYAALTDQLVKYTWVMPTVGLADAQTATILFRGNPLGTTPVNTNIVLDNLMIEELNGDPVEGSPFVAGAPDIFKLTQADTVNANAISTTNAEVSRINGVVVAQGTQLTNLASRMTTVEGTLSTKADATALTSLTTRVTNAETTLSTQATSITTLTAELTTLSIGGANLWSLQATGHYEGGVVTAPHARVSVSGNVISYTNKAASSRIGCNVPLTSGRQVTIRFKPIEGVTDGVVYMRALTSTGAQADSQKTVTATLKDGYYYVVLPATRFPSTTASVNFGIGGAGAATTVVSEVTVQYGNKATAWTDSYRDIPVIDLSGYATTAALSTLDAKVTNIDGRVTANATQLTQLNSSLTTTNNNVTAAQNAAAAASSLAGSKGKVLVQTTAPIVADRLVQNLWIDITGNANTPKRWNGSAWVAVTDKVATDAAAAAANALSVAQTKADASALTRLTTKVDTIDGKVTAQATQLSSLSTTVGTHTASITSQQTSINGLSAKATIQVAAGNTIGGVSLGNNGGVVDFIVRANTFAIAPPVSANAGNAGKYAFNYRATPVTLPNGTVVPAGIYADNAVIHSIDASKLNVESLSAISANLGTIKVGSANIADLAVTTANISDAAVTTAKINNLAVTTAKIGDLQVDTLKIKDNAVTIGVSVNNSKTISIQSSGGKVLVTIGVQARFSNITSPNPFTLKRNGINIHTWQMYETERATGIDGTNFFGMCGALPPFTDSPPAGMHTYELHTGVWSPYFIYTSMSLMETKK